MPFVSLDSWSWVPVLQFFLPAVPSKAAFVKVSRGGCWIPFFSCICLVAFFLVKAVISLQNLSRLKSEAM